MKNNKDSFSILTDFDSLYAAHQSCRKGKRWKDSVAIYDIRGLECTLALQDLLETGRYKLSPYNCFTINERGKTRAIKSIKYHDRVVQKCLMDQILAPIIEPTFVNTNCASQKGKGTDYALLNMRKHLQQHVRKYGTDGYILICDMHHYFDTIPHEALDRYYSKKFEDPKLLALIKHIHDSIPGGVGVPLGNQLSQLDALLILNDMDHHIKEKMHIKGYGRYNDDFYLISCSKEELRGCLEWIRKHVEAKGMSLNSKKTKIVPITQGVDYLGFRFYVTKSGKVVQKLAKKSIKHHKHKLKKMNKLLASGAITFDACKDAHDGWKAHAARGDTHYLVRKMDGYFNELFEQYTNQKKEENHGKETQ